MSIVCFEIEDWESETLRDLCHGHDAVMVKNKIDVHNANEYESAEIISCFIYSDLRRPVLEKLKNLKLIATRSTGTDHIDLDYCRNHGITVANVPAYGEHTVAEHVFALLLALSRHIPQAVRRTRDGYFSFSGLCGFDLYGKTLGLVGTGAIGLHVAQIATGFGMKVLGYDIHPSASSVFTPVTLDQLLSDSDVISLHVPGTPQTRHMLSEKEFSMMRDGVVIINTARGQVIDVKALLRALQSGKVGAAGLDVLRDQPRRPELPGDIDEIERAEILDDQEGRGEGLRDDRKAKNDGGQIAEIAEDQPQPHEEGRAEAGAECACDDGGHAGAGNDGGDEKRAAIGKKCGRCHGSLLNGALLAPDG